jgi:hypothetical protein
MPNRQDNPELYDTIVLAGVRSPGVVTISGHDRQIGWDVKKGQGQSGASTTRTSEDPVEFTCTFYLVKDSAAGIDDFAEWEDFLTVANSSIAAKDPKALDIYHPDLARVDIKSVVLRKIGGVVHDGLGGETHTLTFLEYRPPKPKGGSPKGSKSKDTKKKGPDPDAARLAELERLTTQYQNTPWGRAA